MLPITQDVTLHGKMRLSNLMKYLYKKDIDILLSSKAVFKDLISEAIPDTLYIPTSSMPKIKNMDNEISSTICTF